MKSQKNEPSFPCQFNEKTRIGMTKRELVAKDICAAIVNQYSQQIVGKNTSMPYELMRNIAQKSVQMTDLLFLELDQPQDTSKAKLYDYIEVLNIVVHSMRRMGEDIQDKHIPVEMAFDKVVSSINFNPPVE